MTWDVRAFAPGRTEIAGNHTDHQGGKTVSATVTSGITILLRRNGTDDVHLESRGFCPVHIDATQRDARVCEANTTAALVRGTIAKLHAIGIDVGGFDAQVESDLEAGGGLSSSAAFEMALAAGLSRLFASRQLDAGQLAAVGCAAEREFFGKPCGLQDQTAIAYGGVSLIDFSDTDRPVVTRLDADVASLGFDIVLVDTACDHSAHNDEFAALVDDMRAVSAVFGKERLGQIEAAEFFASLPRVRAEAGDTASLRALHYYTENRLVDERVAALLSGDAEAFACATRRSAASSAQFLQNVRLPHSSAQPALVALALADAALGADGAARIHGGGFGGSIQAFVPKGHTDEFVRFMDECFLPGCAAKIELSEKGADAQCLR